MSASIAPCAVIVTAAALVLAWASNAHAQATLVLGDSLSDTGNAFRLSDQSYPDPTFYNNGRFSNGLMWSDYLASKPGYYADILMGVPSASQVDSWIFAVAGATTGLVELDAETSTPPGLLTQVRDYRAAVGARVIAGPQRARLAIIWAGANDYGDRASDPLRNPSEDAAFVGRVVGNIEAAISGVAAAGVQDVTVLNLMDFSLAPSARSLPQEMGAAGDTLVKAHNRALLNSVNAHVGARVVLVDVAALLRDVVAAPTVYGITNTTTPCLPDGAAPQCPTPEAAGQRMFWDGTHLTEAGHALVAETIRGTVHSAAQTPRQAAVSTEVAMTLLDHDRTLQSGLDAWRSDDSALSVWASSNALETRRGARPGRAGFRADGDSVAIGAEGRISEALTMGGTLSVADLDANHDDAVSRTRGRVVTVSGYARYQSSSVWVAGQAGHAWIDLDMERDTRFGPAPLANGATQASAVFADVVIADRLAWGDASLSPVMKLRWTDVRVDDWSETHGRIMNASIDDQRRNSLIGSLGLMADWSGTVVSRRVRVYTSAFYETELGDQDWEVRATLGSDQQIASNAEIGSKRRFNGEAGITAELWDALWATVSYRKLSGAHDSRDARFSAALTYRF